VNPKNALCVGHAHPLARIIEQLKREPSRTGSIVITVFGDAIVPRGGSVWLGTLLAFSRPSISTAAWCARRCRGSPPTLARTQQGRPQQFLPVGKKGRQTFDAATKHIYDPQPSDWTGRFELLLIGNSGDRDASREALKNAGFGSPLPGVWIAPSGVPIPEDARALSGWKCPQRTTAATITQRKLAAASHRRCLSEIHETFEPLRGWIGRRERLSDVDAFTARILLIHYYRRVVLRDPLLPTTLLPADWPAGQPASSAASLSRAASGVRTMA